MNNRFIILLFAAFLLMSNSTGFDMYSHSANYYYEVPTGKSYVFFDIVILPRYFFLSYIYEFFSSMGIPLGYVFVGLCLYALNSIVKSMEVVSVDNQINIRNVIFLFLSYFLVFFYSGLSLSLLWSLAYLLSGRKVFLFGAYFHPISFLLFFLITIFTDKKIKYLLYSFIVFIVFIFLQSYVYSFFNVAKLSSWPQYIYMSSITIYIDKVTSKLAEIKMVFLFIIIYFIDRKFSLKHRINYNFITISLMAFSISVAIYMIPKGSLLYHIYSKQSIDNLAIYTTWFDFGQKDIDVGRGEIRNSRTNWK